MTTKQDTLKEAAQKHASQFCISIPTREVDLKLNEEITRVISKHYLAGAAFARDQVIKQITEDAERLDYDMATVASILKRLKEVQDE